MGDRGPRTAGTSAPQAPPTSTHGNRPVRQETKVNRDFASDEFIEQLIKYEGGCHFDGFKWEIKNEGTNEHLWTSHISGKWKLCGGEGCSAFTIFTKGFPNLKFKPKSNGFVLEHPQKTRIEAQQMTLDFLFQQKLSHQLYCRRKSLSQDKYQAYLGNLRDIQKERIGHFLAAEEKILSQLKADLNRAYEAYEARRDIHEETYHSWKKDIETLTIAEENALKVKTNNPIDLDHVALKFAPWVMPERKVLVRR